MKLVQIMNNIIRQYAENNDNRTLILLILVRNVANRSIEVGPYSNHVSS